MRQIEKIPQGIYCYRIFTIHKNKDSSPPIIEIACCPFFQKDYLINGHCDLLDVEIKDCLKECSHNVFTYEQEE